MKYLTLFLFILASCTAQTLARLSSPSPAALDEVRVALMDVRQAYSKQEMEMEILEEKVAKMKSPSSQNMSQELETKLLQIEKMQEKLESDIKQLRNHANQTSETLAQYRNTLANMEKIINEQSDRLNEVGKLKTTLTSISKAMSTQSVTSALKSYKVRSGDSLEKIAKQNNTTIETLKQINNLNSSTILIGQDLKIPE